MAIGIVFMSKNKIVLRINMCFSYFEGKILNEILIEDQGKRIFEYDNNNTENTFLTDRKLVEKIWYACTRHGYISEDYNVMGKQVDAMRIEL